ncbi:LytTR family DNA-binding domain-containing protein [Chitinophaga caseinilytica]|uniref:LytTR family DNA-binding domain-containing protein n=1 Tax=Chitinophaga caseinilytica TaxID=2267521 RepID=A0ABZ2Z3K4_9BACT
MMKCIALDDEPLALEIIADFAAKAPFQMELTAFTNASRALGFLQQEPVDLIFLDIKMPDITGIQFIKSLKRPPMVIFTTAYEEYALDGYNLDVVDYLLKPIPFERFIKAVTKAQEYRSIASPRPPETDYIFVKTEYRIIKVNLEDILYIEALKDYIKIYTGSQPILTLKSLKSFESRLPKDKFMRVHRSYLVAMNKINSVERNTVMIANQSIPISEGYRDKFYDVITRHS